MQKQIKVNYKKLRSYNHAKWLDVWLQVDNAGSSGIVHLCLKLCILLPLSASYYNCLLFTKIVMEVSDVRDGKFQEKKR